MTIKTDDRIAIAREADRILDEPTVTYELASLSDGSGRTTWHQFECNGDVLTIDRDGTISLGVACTELGTFTFDELRALAALVTDSRIGDILQRIREP